MTSGASAVMKGAATAASAVGRAASRRLLRGGNSSSAAAAESPLSEDFYRAMSNVVDPEDWDTDKLGKLLVANRGEIACRVLATARRLGVPTVALFSEADTSALHVALADEAVCVGPAAARESYLRSDRILEAARSLGVGAIHPGYGFLSENAAFAESCSLEGIKFVGPPSSAILSMGDKKEAKEVMAKAGVAVVPGYHGADQSLDRLQTEANRIGFPLLIKAVMGGGGKGMKLAMSPKDVKEAILSAQREAEASFGDGRVLLERFIEVPRHIEVQVLGDAYGNTVYLFERDCSVQRRHQKVIEEAPAPEISEEFREQLGKSAVAAAKAVGYTNAGTVEFIMDTDTGEYFFMEMNTRLQVEHPVTEMITGKDLVELQLRVAAGQPLPFQQGDLRIQGHAVEARIYAENPAKDFLPASGKIALWSTPPGSGSFTLDNSIRVDSGVRAGDQVGINYDPMIAKLIAHGKDRNDAIQKLEKALGQLHVAGLPTNVAFVQALLTHPAFRAAKLNTRFIEDHKASLHDQLQDIPSKVVALAGLSRVLELERQHLEASSGQSPWDTASNKRLNGISVTRTVQMIYGPDAAVHKIAVVTRDGAISVSGLQMHENAEEEPRWSFAVRSSHLRGNIISAEINGKLETATVVWLPDQGIDGSDTLDMWHAGQHFHLTLPARSGAAGEAAVSGNNAVVSPMPGKVLRVLVSEGQEVRTGDAVAVVEAMKMEHTLRAAMDGTISQLSCAEGGQVQDGHVMAVIDAATKDSSTIAKAA